MIQSLTNKLLSLFCLIRAGSILAILLIASSGYTRGLSSIGGVEGFSKISQQNTVRGKVVNAYGEALGGVTVGEKNTTTTTQTDETGQFSINVSSGKALLVFTYVGYNVKEVSASEASLVQMELETGSLEEVVVIGYGTARKKDLTGSVASIRPSQLETTSPASVQDILRSGVPGLIVGASNDASAGGVGLQIRGQRSLKAGNDPLIVVDNMIFYGSLNEINPLDIEQIDVLKDASSAAIFGAKSANGVIIITTKKGKSVKPVVRFDATLGLSDLTQQRKIYDAKGYLQFRSDYLSSAQDGFANPGRYAYPSADNLAKYGMSLDEWRSFSSISGSDEDLWLARLGLAEIEIANYKAGKTYDWTDQAFQTGINQDYNVSVSGKMSDVANYYLSLGNRDANGVLKNDNYNTTRINTKIDARIGRYFEVSGNLNLSDRSAGNLANSSYGTTLTYNSPYVLPYDDDGNYIYQPWGTAGNNVGYNYMYDKQFQEHESGYTSLNSMLTAKIKLPFDIVYTFNIAPRMEWYQRRHWYSAEHEVWKDTYGGGRVLRDNSKRMDWSLNNTINWDYAFATKHRINVTLSQEAEERRYWGTSIDARGMDPTDALGFHYIDSADKNSSSFSSVDTRATADALLGRVFYAYDDRYMLTLSARRDGYSAFGLSNPRATFSSAAIAWTFTNEDFFNWKPLDYGKLRISYGTNGNRDIGMYTALSNLTTGSGRYPYLDANGNASEFTQLYVSRMANYDLKWEQTASWNVGLDFGFLDSRISGSLEYYHMPTTDLIMDQTLPNVTGFSSVTTNLGEVVNSGIEITLNTINIRKKDFQWNSAIGLAHNKNNIKHLYYRFDDVIDDNGHVIGSKEVDDVANGWFIGKPISAIWNYKFEGIWQEGDEIVGSYKPGDVKVLDVNDDGKYANEDKVFQGQTSPKVRWSFRNDFTYKNWSAAINMYSYMGHKAANTDYQNVFWTYDRSNTYERKYWTPENPTNEYARLNSSTPVAAPKIIDRSFIRLESIALSYDIPKTILTRYGIGGLRFHTSVRNAALWTSEWELGDVETGSYIPRTYSFGASLTF
jgi:TonB-linked SusC/RagA family outer membrane protein